MRESSSATNGVGSSSGSGSSSPSGASASSGATKAAARRRAARPAISSSVRRRRFSTSAAFSTLGQAQISPRLSGAPVWYAARKRSSRSVSSRPSLWRSSSTARKCTRGVERSPTAASVGSWRW